MRVPQFALLAHTLQLYGSTGTVLRWTRHSTADFEYELVLKFRENERNVY
jgi:hypothetical protein